MDITRIKNLVDAEIRRKIGMAALCEETGQTKAASEHREVAAALDAVLQVYLNEMKRSCHSVGPAPPGALHRTRTNSFFRGKDDNCCE